MKKFFQARVKLTFFYSLILLFVSFILSGIYYQQTAGIINFHTKRINHRLEQDFSYDGVRKGPRRQGLMVKDELQEARQKILQQIIIINGVLLIFGVGASYYLSGKTLRPIKKSLESQKQFIADAAHELKTPVTALKTSVEVSLVNKKLSAPAKEVLRDNLAEIDSLASLTENLLSLAQAENGLKRDFSSVLLAEVVEDAVGRVRALAKQKEIEIKWSRPTSKKEFVVLGDEVLLSRALVILLDNAIKYSPPQSKVEVNLKKEGKQVKLEVIDQGQGISLEEQQHVFKRFYRVEEARTKSGVGGHGLGLAVAKKIIDQHQGKISIESKLGEGSRFICTFNDGGRSI